MDEVQTVSLAGGVKEVTVIPHGRNTRRPSTVTVQQYHLSLIIHNSLVFFFFLQGRVVNISFCRSLDPDVTALAVETCMSTFAFYHKFWHTYMLIFAGTNTILLSLILFRKKLPMRDMNRRYFMYDSMLLHTAWLLVIPYSAIVAIIIYSVYYRNKAFLLSIKEAYPFLKSVITV